MGHRRSEKRAEHESLMLQALEGIAKKKWKNTAQAAKAPGISRYTIGRRLNGGNRVAESRESDSITHNS